MAGFGNLIQKAVYLGVGLASYANEKASTKLTELRTEAQKLADELVQRGEMTTEEARQMVDNILKQATKPTPPSTPQPTTPGQPTDMATMPRTIEIASEDEETEEDELARLRNQVSNLQSELQQLQS